MAGDFGEVLSKLRWARHQAAIVNLACADYIDQDPAEVVDDPSSQSHRIVAKLRLPPPASLAHAVGDALSSLHGTLDYLAAQLVLREGGAPDLKTLFPIKGPTKDGSEPWVNITTAGKGGRGEVSAIKDPAVLALLRPVQPYHDGGQARLHFLHVLRTLNGASKHRRPVVLTSASIGASFMTGAGSGGVGTESSTLIVTAPRRIDDGDEITRIAYADGPHGCFPEQAVFTPHVTLWPDPVCWSTACESRWVVPLGNVTASAVRPAERSPEGERSGI